MLFTPLLLIKLLLTPCLMLGVSLAARKWGAFWGGLLSGLPLTSGVILTFLAIEQGENFAHHTALAAIPGLAAVLCTYWIYLTIGKHRSAIFAGMAALTGFTLVSLALTQLNVVGVSLSLLLCMIAVLIYLTGREYVPQAVIIKKSVWDLPLRILASTSLLLLITALAPLVGATISGVISTIPVIAWPLTLFTHFNYGRNQMLLVVRGNAIGALGVLAFYVVMLVLLSKLHLSLVVMLSTLTSILIPLILNYLLKNALKNRSIH